ncbi:colossin B [Tieghemostelium lacteum]|uniref:Colossin B n=1 Tax=Tieghemostelium lacteum TaxID=361077 RepID=A0A151ZFZ6_TIELA|nr:colossin B [Tieghemostelium lacteum]|eukprot:KYQ92901.1 colossin B [Tieghemostelium lacteum]
MKNSIILVITVILILDLTKIFSFGNSEIDTVWVYQDSIDEKWSDTSGPLLNDSIFYSLENSWPTFDNSPYSIKYLISQKNILEFQLNDNLQFNNSKALNFQLYCEGDSPRLEISLLMENGESMTPIDFSNDLLNVPKKQWLNIWKLLPSIDMKFVGFSIQGIPGYSGTVYIDNLRLLSSDSEFYNGCSVLKCPMDVKCVNNSGVVYYCQQSITDPIKLNSSLNIQNSRLYEPFSKDGYHCDHPCYHFHCPRGTKCYSRKGKPKCSSYYPIQMESHIEVVCPQGYKLFEWGQNERYCAPYLYDCFHLTCPYGKTCRMNTDTNEPYCTDELFDEPVCITCKGVRCPPGFECIIQEGKAKCQIIPYIPTTFCPEYDEMCPNGFVCAMVNNEEQCIRNPKKPVVNPPTNTPILTTPPILSSSTTSRPVLTTSTTILTHTTSTTKPPPATPILTRPHATSTSGSSVVVTSSISSPVTIGLLTTISSTLTPTPTPAPNRTFAVGQRVWIDNSNDGIYNPGVDIPLVDIFVSLYSQSGKAILQSITDKDGIYYMDMVPEGYYMSKLDSPIPDGIVYSGLSRYPVNSKTKFTPQFYVGLENSDFEMNNGRFPVTASYINPYVNYPLIPGDLERYALGDFIWYDTNKNGVADPGEKGIKGLEVHLLSLDSKNLLSKTTTNRLGIYYFDNLPTGAYRVSFIYDDGYSVTYSTIIDSSITNRVLTFPILLSQANPSVQAREPKAIDYSAPWVISTIDLPLTYYPDYAMGILAFIDTNNDGIFNPEFENTLPGVSVRLWNFYGTDYVSDIYGIEVRYQITNAEGYYSFDLLKEGVYYVQFDVPAGYKFTTPPIVETFYIFSNVDQSIGTSPAIDLHSLARDTFPTDGVKAKKIYPGCNVGFTAITTFSVGDIVWYDNNQNGLLDEGEPGVEGISVMLLTTDNQIATNVYGNQIPIQYTDPLGQYWFINVPEGVYHIKFNNLPVGYKWTTQYASSPNGIFNLYESKPNEHTGITDNFKLAIGQHGVRPTSTIDNLPDHYVNDNIDAGIIPGTKVNPDSFGIGRYIWIDSNQNQMRDSNEQGVQGIKVMLLNRDGSLATNIQGLTVQPVYTDEYGRYYFDNLSAGTYQIQFKNLPSGYNFIRSGPPHPFYLTGRTPLFNLTKSTSTGRKKEIQPISVKTQLDSNKVSTDTFESITTLTDLIPYLFTLSIGSISSSISTTTTIIEYDSHDTATSKSGESFSTIVTQVSTTTTTSGGQNPNVYPDFPDLTGISLHTGANWEIYPPPPVGYSDQFESLPGSSKLSDAKADFMDLTRNAGLMPSLSFGVGDCVYYLDSNGTKQFIANITAIITDIYGGDVTDQSGNIPMVATTDENGRYLIDNLKPGLYKVIWGNLPAGFKYKQPETGVQSFLLDRTSPTVRATQVTDFSPLSVLFDPTVDLELSPPSIFAIGDMVWEDRNGDGFRAFDDPPVTGAIIELMDGRGLNYASNKFGIPLDPVTTDSTGVYYFDNLAEGTYVVRFTPPPGYQFTAQLGVGKPGSGYQSFSSAPNKTGYTHPIYLSPVANGITIISPPLKTKNIKATAGNFNIDAGLTQKRTNVDTFTLGRWVFIDENANGEKDSGDTPVANVTVSIFSIDGSPIYDESGQIVKPVLSNDQGEYRFTDVLSGTYQLQFSGIPDGYTFSPMFSPSVATGITNEVNFYFNSPNVQLAKPSDNVTTKYVDFTINSGLVPSATLAIGDLVWYDMNGDGIYQTDSEPGARNIIVTLTNTQLNQVSQTITDSKGRYIFDNLQTGVYKLQFRSQYSSIQTSPIFRGNTTNDTNKAVNGQILDIQLSQFFDVQETLPADGLIAQYINNIQDVGILKPYLYSVGQMVWLDENKNSIIDDNENGIANVTVSLRRTQDSLTSVYTDIFGNLLTANSNETGHYWINFIEAGYYVASFTNLPKGHEFTLQDKDSSASAIGWSYLIKLVQNESNIYDSTIDKGAKNATYVNRYINAGLIDQLNQLKTYKLSGHVYMDMNRNGKFDIGETLVKGINVTLLDKFGNPSMDRYQKHVPIIQTNDQGYYQFKNLLEGIYQVQFDGTTAPRYMYYSPIDQNNNNRSLISGIQLTQSNSNITDLPFTDIDQLILNDQNAGLVRVSTFSVGDRIIPNYLSTVLESSRYNGSGITVKLLKNGLSTNDINGLPVAPQTVGSDGIFLFTEIPEDAGYSLSFSNIPPEWIYEPLRQTNFPFDRTYSTSFFDLPNPNSLVNVTDGNRYDLSRDIVITPVILGIGDLAFLDLDDSGTQLVPAAPMSNISVQLLGANKQPVTDAFGNLVKIQKTDSQGFYNFQSLLPGNYRVYFSLPDGYAYCKRFSGGDQSLDSNIDANGMSNLVSLDSSSPTLSLYPGQNRQINIASDNSVDGGFIQLIPAGFITGMSFIDYNSDGLYNSRDRPYPNMTVTLYDREMVVSQTVTDQNGQYSFINLDIGKNYQVLFSLAPYPYKATLTPGGRGGYMQLPKASQTDVNIGINIPYYHCQDNPEVILTCFARDDAGVVAPDYNETILVSFPYNSYSDVSGDYSFGRKQSWLQYYQTGSIFGVAYDRAEGVVYTTPFLKQGTVEATPGRIYRHYSPGNFSVFLDVNVLLGNQYTINSKSGGFEIGYVYFRKFGDIDIVDDFLYATVLSKNTILKIPLRVQSVKKKDITILQVKHICPGGPNDFQIAALGYDGENMYVGGVCTGITGNSSSNTLGVIKKINKEFTNYTDALIFSFDYPRGYLQCYSIRGKMQCYPYQRATWNQWPWTSDRLALGSSFWPHPQIFDLTFIGYQGNMVISIRDREADFYNNIPAGDILYACKDSKGQYQLESGGSCGNLIGAHVGASGGEGSGNFVPEGPGNGEFFDDNFVSWPTQWVHDETMWGTAVHLPGTTEVMSTGYDLNGINQGTVLRLSTLNGSKISGFIVYQKGGSFTKLNGLGDIDIMCELPPTYIGNLVWDDLNGNGLQDSQEPGISNVTIDLYYTANNTFYQNTTTNSLGNYIFKVSPNVGYTTYVRIPPLYKATIQYSQYKGKAIDPIFLNSKIDSNGTSIIPPISYGENIVNNDAGLISI